MMGLTSSLKSLIFTGLVLSGVLVGSFADAGSVSKSLGRLPVQDGGRVKPFEAFANEALRLIHGKTHFKKRSATEVIMTWLLAPEAWEDVKLFEVRLSSMREALQITDGGRLHYSPKEIFSNDRLPLLFQELRSRRDRGQKLTPYYQAIQRLENQMALFHAIKTGQVIRVAPGKESELEEWYPIAELPPELNEKFLAITQSFLKAVSEGESGSGKVSSEALRGIDQAVDEFMSAARAKDPAKYADLNIVRAELHLNQFHPFRWAWVAYLVGLLLFVSSLVSKRASFLKWSGFAFLVGFLLHTYGMGIRSYISGRPPVSNMYETVIWVPWGAIVFAYLLDRWQKTKSLTPVAAAISIFCLILSDLAPAVLDASIHPLEPVLRSTFWLTTHVLIITVSYAAFFLAFALGDLLMFYHLKDEKAYSAEIRRGAQSIYRSIQIGVVLLAAGIILGGIWADESWGRYWGWDPKETWALIALLGYIAILHARLVGWLRPFGMAAASVVAFSLVIMAWYGVNFVLGAGLHTYGFGAGGVEYVSLFVVAHLLFVIYVGVRRRALQADKG